MNRLTLQGLMRVRGWSQSDVARMAGVSRQAVSLWFRNEATESIDMRVSHLAALCRAARVSADDLLQSLPGNDNPKERRMLEAELLWDHLYPDPNMFAGALADFELVAVARLVQVRGIYAAARILGDRVWSEFLTYRQFMKPVRRKECERLWKLRRRLH